MVARLATTSAVCLTIALLSAFLSAAWDEPASLTVIALACTLAASSLHPLTTKRLQVELVLHPLATALVALLVAGWMHGFRFSVPLYASSIAFICMACQAVRLHVKQANDWVPTLAFCAWCAAPLVLGQIGASHPLGSTLQSALITYNPVSYIAAALNYDYLRSPWFYQHAPYASDLANHTDAWSIALLYAVSVGLLVVTARPWRHTTTLEEAHEVSR